MKFVYLASPYSHPNPHVMQARYEEVRLFIALTLRSLDYLNAVCISPILHNHNVAVHHKLPRDFSFWEKVDSVLLEHCDELWILQLNGWKESRGVALEKERTTQLGLPIRYASMHNKTHTITISDKEH